MRPTRLGDVVGQDHILGPGTPLRRAIDEDRPFSAILWGPPGSGKTSIARVVAAVTRAHFVSLSAVLSGVKEVRQVMEEAAAARAKEGRRTVLFIDEIHRFNKAQQDAFLHHVEAGEIVLIGATTENPSFSVISALLSRCRVLTLRALKVESIALLLERALGDGTRGLAGEGIRAEAAVLEAIARLAEGDARVALAALETASHEAAERPDRTITMEDVARVVDRRMLVHDKAGEEHYNILSALHKSLRGSDPNAALYWLARLLAAGEDPLVPARRMIRFAVEDVGLADPSALVQAVAARDAFQMLGSPEGELALAQCALYLATAPKSNAVYRAMDRAIDEIGRSGSQPVPLHIRNAPTALMKGMGYGEGYQYDHDVEGGVAAQDYLPPPLAGSRFYVPGPYGFEREVARRMAWFEKMRARPPGRPAPSHADGAGSAGEATGGECAAGSASAGRSSGPGDAERASRPGGTGREGWPGSTGSAGRPDGAGRASGPSGAGSAGRPDGAGRASGPSGAGSAVEPGGARSAGEPACGSDTGDGSEEP